MAFHHEAATNSVGHIGKSGFFGEWIRHSKSKAKCVAHIVCGRLDRFFFSLFVYEVEICGSARFSTNRVEWFPALEHTSR